MQFHPCVRRPHFALAWGGSAIAWGGSTVVRVTQFRIDHHDGAPARPDLLCAAGAHAVREDDRCNYQDGRLAPELLRAVDRLPVDPYSFFLEI